MNEEIQESVFEHTGKLCVDSFKIKGGNGLRMHYRIILEDGTEYLCKTIKMSKDRMYTYKKIVNMNISCFQKTVYMWLFQNDIYVVLVEWKKGKLISEYELKKYNSLNSIIKQAASEIRHVHKDFMTSEKIIINQCDIENFFKKYIDFLDEDLYRILKSYVLENYQFLNGRNRTVVHGDLHFRNILNTSNGILIIDLDDCSFGDQYKDLIYASNIIKSSNESVLCYEFLMNYFENQIPQEFWIIVNIYSIYKAMHIMRCEKENTCNHKPIYSLESFVEQHKMMTSHVPLWFEKIEKR